MEQPSIRSILKTQTDPLQFCSDVNFKEIKADKILDDDQSKNNSDINRLSNNSAKNDLNSTSFANLKFAVGKDGSLLYTYE